MMIAIIKRLFIRIVVLSLLFCGLIIVCACRPDITELIAEFLYSEPKQDKLVIVSYLYFTREYDR